MALLFKDDLLDEFGSWALSYIATGGPEFAEIQAVGAVVGDGDARAFNKAWIAAGDRRFSQAEEAKKSGHLATARDLYLRASAFYVCSYHPLYGKPVDPVLLAAYDKQISALNAAFALFDPPIVPQSIPFEGASMAAYFIPAADAPRAKRPTIILTNGFDATITDMYFASAVAASRRGYHCLLFDGPGQGGMLYHQNVPMRPDWEVPVRAVVDFALTLPEVDSKRLVLSGSSLGGYLAPRAASGEHRLAACIADPGQFAISDSVRPLAQKLGATPESAANLGLIDDATLQKFQHVIEGNPGLRWKIIQRGFWVFGVDSLRDFLRKSELFTMAGRAELIQCPTLITAAESDSLASGAKTLFDAMKCPKTLIPFVAADSAQTHCEMGNRTRLNQVALDWLDETLGPPR
jgi:alpha-beta hydrolase superfamily lysophospholipase